MADPFTLSFIAANCVWGAVKGLSGQAAVAAAKRLAEAIRNSQTPGNHDILAATHAAFVRSIQLMADACDQSGSNPKDQFSSRALSKLARDPDFTTFRFGRDQLLPKRALDASIRSIFQGANPDPVLNAVDAVIAQIEQAMREPLTEPFRILFREGSDKHRSWPQAFELFFAEEVKEKQRVFNILTLDRLNQLVAFATEHANGLASLHRQIVEFWQRAAAQLSRIEDNTAAALANDEAMLAAIREIAARQGTDAARASIELLSSIAAQYRDVQPNADLESLRTYLFSKIGEYHQLRERIQEVEHEDNHDASLLADANLAIGQGAFDRADHILSEAENLLDERVARLLIRKSERRALRGDAARLKGDYETALTHYDAASEMLPAEATGPRQDHAWSAAIAAVEWASRSGQISAIQDAVSRWKALGDSVDRVTSPESWARVRIGLANSLRQLGERTGDQSALRSAVTVLRGTQRVYKRNIMPFEWAQVQGDLGCVHSTIGSYSEGTEAFRRAAAAQRRALKIYSPTETPTEWANAQSNLGHALMYIGVREGRPRMIQAACEAVRKSSQFFARDKDFYDWASIMNNLAISLKNLGVLTDSADALRESIRQYELLFAAWPPDRWQSFWAATQDGYGNTLKWYGTLLNDEKHAQKAVAAHRAAILIRTREQVPFQWALTMENLAHSLMALAKITKCCVTARSAIEALESALEVFARPEHDWNRRKAEDGLAVALELVIEICN